jgi:hypothetical protein
MICLLATRLIEESMSILKVAGEVNFEAFWGLKELLKLWIEKRAEIIHMEVRFVSEGSDCEDRTKV